MLCSPASRRRLASRSRRMVARVSGTIRRWRIWTKPPKMSWVQQIHPLIAELVLSKWYQEKNHLPVEVGGNKGTDNGTNNTALLWLSASTTLRVRVANYLLRQKRRQWMQQPTAVHSDRKDQQLCNLSATISSNVTCSLPIPNVTEPPADEIPPRKRATITEPKLGARAARICQTGCNECLPFLLLEW